MGRGLGQELLTQLVEQPTALHVVALHAALSDKGAGAHLGFDQARELELGVGSTHGVGVDGEVDRELPHRRQPIAGLDGAGSQPLHQLVPGDKSSGRHLSKCA